MNASTACFAIYNQAVVLRWWEKKAPFSSGLRVSIMSIRSLVDS